MATIPLWVIGANVSAFSIAPCSVDATGQITINTALSLRGRWQEFSFQPKYELKEIAAADQFVKSQVPTALSATIMIKEIEQLAPQIGVNTDTNASQNVFNQARLVYLTVTRNIQGAGLKTWSCYLVIEEFEIAGQREEFIDSLTLQLTSARDTSGNEISLAVA